MEEEKGEGAPRVIQRSEGSGGDLHRIEAQRGGSSFKETGGGLGKPHLEKEWCLGRPRLEKFIVQLNSSNSLNMATADLHSEVSHMETLVEVRFP